ncbi:ATP-binding protein [Spongiactinospora rosea]|uniref:ATP-binding protein n=2 Tax=Spongiactinospora rosea TaxID=2248750 RepID=A0A366M718_9ACTN|nr:ATP-binding protein [Spongiactinospora rosea]
MPRHQPTEYTLGTVTLPGTHRAVAVGRHWAEALLEAGGRKGNDDALLVLDELAANAVTHTRSGTTGGRFVVALVEAEEGGVRIEVTDEGADTVPAPRHDDMDALSGRGLQIVAALAADWGVRAAGKGRLVWALLRPDTADPAVA